MVGEAGAAHVLVLRLERVEVRLERRLRVDDDLLASRELDEQVGPEPRAVGGDRRLLDEVAVGEHPGHLDHSAQLDLAPAAAHDRRAQGRDEVAGLRTQLLLRLGQLPHLHAQLGVRLCPGDLELLELPVHLLQRLPDRGDEVLHRLAALLEVVRRPLLELLELGLRKLEEGLVARRERIGGERLHRHRERVARVLERREPAAVVQARDRRGRGGADGETEDEGDQGHGPTNGRSAVGRCRCRKEKAGPDEPVSPSEPARGEPNPTPRGGSSTRSPLFAVFVATSRERLRSRTPPPRASAPSRWQPRPSAACRSCR
jgi:hypothetical protein